SAYLGESSSFFTGHRAIYPGRRVEAFVLALFCVIYGPTEGSRFVFDVGGEKPVVLHARYVDHHVDAVQKRAGDFLLVLFDLVRPTYALMLLIACISARARVTGGNKHKIGGETRAVVRPSDCYMAILKGLSQGFECLAAVFGQLIQEENAAVREANLTRARDR